MSASRAPTLTQVWDACRSELVPPDMEPLDQARAYHAFRAGASAILSLLLATAGRADQTPEVRRALSELASALHAPTDQDA